MAYPFATLTIPVVWPGLTPFKASRSSGLSVAGSIFPMYPPSSAVASVDFCLASAAKSPPSVRIFSLPSLVSRTNHDDAETQASGGSVLANRRVTKTTRNSTAAAFLKYFVEWTSCLPNGISPEKPKWKYKTADDAQAHFLTALTCLSLYGFVASVAAGIREWRGSVTDSGKPAQMTPVDEPFRYNPGSALSGSGIGFLIRMGLCKTLVPSTRNTLQGVWPAHGE